jgi:hypothetical protein
MAKGMSIAFWHQPELLVKLLSLQAGSSFNFFTTSSGFFFMFFMVLHIFLSAA